MGIFFYFDCWIFKFCLFHFPLCFFTHIILIHFPVCSYLTYLFTFWFIFHFPQMFHFQIFIMFHFHIVPFNVILFHFPFCSYLIYLFSFWIIFHFPQCSIFNFFTMFHFPLCSNFNFYWISILISSKKNFSNENHKTSPSKPQKSLENAKTCLFIFFNKKKPITGTVIIISDNVHSTWLLFYYAAKNFKKLKKQRTWLKNYFAVTGARHEASWKLFFTWWLSLYSIMNIGVLISVPGRFFFRVSGPIGGKELKGLESYRQ